MNDLMNINQRELPLMALLLQFIQQDNNEQNQLQLQSMLRQQQSLKSANKEGNEMDILNLMAEQLKRETRALEENQRQIALNDILYNTGVSPPIKQLTSGGAKRIPFTPRIGRKR